MKQSLMMTVAAVALFSTAPDSAYAEDPLALVKEGKFFGEVRYRYEGVEQDGIDNDARANTTRVNFGFKTGEYYDFSGLIEGQFVHHWADEDFNSSGNGNTAYPVVADPDTKQINRAWINYAGIPDTNIKIGRQAVNMDNQRFIGTVGWRQNDQTFDAGTITNNSIENLNLQYSYIGNVNRIFGGTTVADDLDSIMHLANASYQVTDWLKITGYAYLMEFENAAALSNETYGVRANGKVALNDDWSFLYEAEYATQEDYGNNTANYDENYYHISPGISGHGLTLKAGYEVLEGDQTNAFKTPLATLHKFNGWADKFLTTPANGLEDLYVSAVYKASGTGTFIDGTKFITAYHNYEGEESGEYGDEINLAVGRSFKLEDAGQPFKNINVLLKYADYNAEDTLYTDTRKLWLQIGVKF